MCDSVFIDENLVPIWYVHFFDRVVSEFGIMVDGLSDYQVLVRLK